MKKRKSSVLILAAFAVLCSSWVIGKGYKTDNIPFKNQLIAINNSIDYFVFHKASNKRVILGEDQWLFYDCKDDGDPIGSYQGTNLFTESDLLAIKNNCIAQRDFLASLSFSLCQTKNAFIVNIFQIDMGNLRIDIGQCRWWSIFGKIRTYE
mgnify:CR=1 FL=1